MQLNVTPEALASASGQITSLTKRLTTANATHSAVNAMIGPPGSDVASIRTCISLQVGGIEHAAMAALGNFQLAESSDGIRESGTSYATGEGQAVATYTAAGGA